MSPVAACVSGTFGDALLVSSYQMYYVAKSVTSLKSPAQPSFVELCRGTEQMDGRMVCAPPCIALCWQLESKMSAQLEGRINTLESLNLEHLRTQEAQAEVRISKLEETLNSQVCAS